jgi:hypothetical protein
MGIGTPLAAGCAPAKTLKDERMQGGSDETPGPVTTVTVESAEASPGPFATPPPPRTPARSSCARNELREAVCFADGAPKAALDPLAWRTQAQPLPQTRRGVPVQFPTDDTTYDPGLTDIFQGRLQQEHGRCYSKCIDVAGNLPAEPAYDEHETNCFFAPEAGTSHPPAADQDCPANLTLSNGRGKSRAPFRGATAFHDRKTCCYGPAPPGFHWRGRALRGPGGALLTESAERRDWLAALEELDVSALGDSERHALAEVWLRDAAFEHASVAAFSHLSLELLALAAPPDLIEDAHRAALDEIEHARLSYALASRYSGRSLGPGRLETRNGDPSSFESLARETFRDGCYGETVATLLAQAAAERAEHPTLREIYETIARDEQRHAELAWRVLAWCVMTSEAARRVLAVELDQLCRAQDPPLASRPEPELSIFGVLGGPHEARIRALTIREIIAPCARALSAFTTWR